MRLGSLSYIVQKTFTHHEKHKRHEKYKRHGKVFYKNALVYFECFVVKMECAIDRMLKHELGLLTQLFCVILSALFGRDSLNCRTAAGIAFGGGVCEA